MTNGEKCYAFAHSEIMATMLKAQAEGYNLHEVLFYMIDITTTSFEKINEVIAKMKKELEGKQ